MRITEKQLIVLVDIAKASMTFVGGFGGYSAETISELINQILNQQSDAIVEIDDVKG